MLQTYNAVAGQSIYDVCLNTYGSLDFLFKLVKDSGHGSVDNEPFTGQQFTIDTDLIVDQLVASGLKEGKIASLYTPDQKVSNGTQSLNLVSNLYATSRGIRPNTILNNMYKNTLPDAYTAGTNGETSVSLPQWIGWDIQLLIKEIQPLKGTQFTWNNSSGTLTLLGGLELEQNETIFFLFSKMIV
jgi:hypothetical protein